MKTLFAVALFAVSSFSGSAEPTTFTAPTGCKWNAQAGTCLVSNTHKEPIVCETRTQITTEKDQVTGKGRMTIPAGEADTSITFKVVDASDKILTAKLAVKCQLAK